MPRSYLQVRERVAHAHGQREGGPVRLERHEAVQLQEVALQSREAPIARGRGALRCGVCFTGLERVKVGWTRFDPQLNSIQFDYNSIRSMICVVGGQI
jgi:hypothetical protein